jgi:hypothetical protein
MNIEFIAVSTNQPILSYHQSLTSDPPVILQSVNRQSTPCLGHEGLNWVLFSTSELSGNVSVTTRPL